MKDGSKLVIINPDDYDLLTREISQGVWFMLGLCLVTAFCFYAMKERRPTEPAWWGAIALAMYICGSSVRVGISWATTAAMRRGEPIEHLLGNQYYTASVVLSVAGGAMALWAFSPNRRRVYIIAAAIALSVVIPIAFAFWGI